MRTSLLPSLRLVDESGVPCAEVPIQRNDVGPRLDDLWFMVGSLCNLQCIHCYVASSPTNHTLEALTREEVRGFLAEACGFGLRRVYFTGGEPFVHPGIRELLEDALEVAETTVLTNATAPIRRHLAALGELKSRFPGRLQLRVSLDHYIEGRHDAIRGEGTFRETVENTVRLAELGFHPIITATAEVFRGNPVPREHVEGAFRGLFAGRAEIDVKILPSVLEMGAQLDRVDTPTPAQFVSKARMESFGVHHADLMCHSGRSVVKREGRVRVYPCPIIYELPEYDLGGSLSESFDRPVQLAHPACAAYCVCRARGTCTNA